MAKSLVALNDVWKALDECLPQHTREQKLHRWWVRPHAGSREMCTLPLGPHGNRKNPDIQCGHVRYLARQFGIMECMTSKLPDVA